jgi:hypothetical protein
LAVAVTYGAALGNEPGSVEQKHMTETQALDRAIAIMGLDKDGTWQRPEVDKAVTKLVMENDDTPFLHMEINGREAYRIVLDDVPLEARSQYGDTVYARTIRPFEVFVDAEDRRLIKVVSKRESFEQRVAAGEIRVPSAGQAEEQLGRMFETYTGLSSDVPRVGALPALARADGNPLDADLIIVRLLNVRRTPLPDKPPVMEALQWVVDTYGTRQYWAFHADAATPEYQLNHKRTVLDTCGHYVHGTNIPYAE